MKVCNYKYCDISNLYGWAMLQKFPIKELKWVKNLSEFNEDFIESYNNTSNEGYFPEGDVQDPKMLHKRHNNLPFLSEIKKNWQSPKRYGQLLWSKRMYYIHNKFKTSVNSRQ